MMACRVVTDSPGACLLLACRDVQSTKLVDGQDRPQSLLSIQSFFPAGPAALWRVVVSAAPERTASRYPDTPVPIHLPTYLGTYLHYLGSLVSR